jgi:hypothetical protein
MSARSNRRAPQPRNESCERTRPTRAATDTEIVEILNTEIARRLLVCFILDCGVRIGEQMRQIRPDAGAIAKLTVARREARRQQRLLAPSDSVLVRRVLEQYGPLVKARFH